MRRYGTRFCRGKAPRRGIESDSTVEKQGKDRAGPQGQLKREILPEIRHDAALRRRDGHTEKYKKKRLFDSMGDRQESITATRTDFSGTDYVEEAEMEEDNGEMNRPATYIALDVHNSSKRSPSQESHTSGMVSAMSYLPSRIGLSNKTTTGTPVLRAPPRRRRSLSPGPEIDGNVDGLGSDRLGGQSGFGTAST